MAMTVYIYIYIWHGLMSHIREAKVTINTSYFHPDHQHYTDEAETVPSVVSYIYILKTQ